MGVLLGLATALSWGAEDYLAAVASRRTGALVALLGLHVVSIVFLGAVLLASGAHDLPAGKGLVLIGLGLIGGLGYLCFLRAMVVAPVSIVTAIVSGYSVVILLWAIVVLGETPGLSQGYGTALTLVGIALACVGLSDLRGATRQGSGLLLSACATLTLGTWIFAIEYYGKSVGVLLALFVGRLTATLLLLGLIAVRLRARRGARPRLLLSALPLVVAAGLLDTFGYLFFQFGAQHSQTAVVAVASSVYFLVPVALAIWLLRERPARKQLLGFALIALGLLLLASPG